MKMARVLWVDSDGECGAVDEKELDQEQLARIDNGEINFFRWNEEKKRYEQAIADQVEAEGDAEEDELSLDWMSV